MTYALQNCRERGALRIRTGEEPFSVRGESWKVEFIPEIVLQLTYRNIFIFFSRLECSYILPKGGPQFGVDWVAVPRFGEGGGCVRCDDVILEVNTLMTLSKKTTAGVLDKYMRSPVCVFFRCLKSGKAALCGQLLELKLGYLFAHCRSKIVTRVCL